MRLNDLLSSAADWLPLLDAAVKATLLLGAAALTTLLLRRGSAASRHLVWISALVAALALPILSMALPRWQVSLVTLTSIDRRGPLHPAWRPSLRQRFAADSVPAALLSSRPDADGPKQVDTALQSKLGESEPTDVARSRTGGDTTAGGVNLSWTSLVFTLWAIGALAILGRLVAGIAAVHVMSGRTERVTDSPWLPLARSLATELGITRITFRRSTHPAMTMPMAWGVVRPVVVMPAEADTWSEARLRIVLLHELAHVKRADCLTHMLAQVSCALYWMNPLAWIAARRARSERERACDDLVLAFGTPGPDYADQLLDIARSMRSGRFSSTLAAASLAMAHRSQLEGRLMAILDPSVPRTGVSRLRTAVASAIALLTLVPLASVQSWTYAQAPAPVAQASPSPQAPQTAVMQQQDFKVRTNTVSQAVVQSAVQGATQGAIQGATQGALQGATQGVIQGATQGAIQGVLQSLPDGGGVFQANPDPRPNPAPEREQEDRAKANPKLVAALTEALKDTDKEVREAAMHALVQMRDPSIYEPLVQALKDGSPDVREQAAFGLGQMRDRRAVAPLVTALKDSAANVREQAAFALGQIRDDGAIDALVAALKDADADVREQAAFALGQLRAKKAVDSLVAAIKDASVSVREQVAFALGQIGDPRAIDALTSALKDASSQVRQQAAFALGQLAR